MTAPQRFAGNDGMRTHRFGHAVFASVVAAAATTVVAGPAGKEAASMKDAWFREHLTETGLTVKIEDLPGSTVIVYRRVQ